MLRRRRSLLPADVLTRDERAASPPLPTPAGVEAAHLAIRGARLAAGRPERARSSPDEQALRVRAGARRLLVLGRARADARLPRAKRRREDDRDARGLRTRRARRRRRALGRAADRAAERLRFGYMPEERGLYPRMPVGEQLEYFGRLHGLDRRRRAYGGRTLARPARARATAPVRRWRSFRTATSSARSSRRRCCTSRSCSSSTSRSPGSTPSPCRRLPRCCAARRRAAPPSSSPAISSTSSRTSARRSRSSTTAGSSRPGTSTTLRRASPRRRIELQLEGAPPEWLPEIAGVELVERRNGDLRLLAGRDVDPEQVLAAAERSARVVEFSYGPPSLAELFLELVAS